MRSRRTTGALVVVAAALIAAPSAAAHSRAPTVALDYRLAVSPATARVPGVHVDLIDGDRALRVRVAPERTLTVLGRRRRHVWAPMLIGVVAAAICLESLSVFWHGVVSSSLPDWAARLSTGAAVLAGAGAAALGALTDDPDDVELPGGIAR